MILRVLVIVIRMELLRVEREMVGGAGLRGYWEFYFRFVKFDLLCWYRLLAIVYFFFLCYNVICFF